MTNNQPQILILHGWGHNKQVWQPVVERLQNDFGDVRAIDLPGFGEEPLPVKSWGVPEYITWVNNYIKSQRFANLILVGHSFGGRITSGIAAQQPDNLRATVLIGAPSIYRPSRRTKRRIFINKIFKLFLPFNLRMRLIGATELVDANKRGIEQVFRNVVAYDQTESLPDITVPTLLLWGEEDVAVPVRIAKEMRQLIPNSKLEILPSLGHNMHIENADLTYGKIKNFIRQVS